MQVCLEGKKVERDHEHEAKAPGNRESECHGAWAHPGEKQDKERGDQSDLRRIVLEIPIGTASARKNSTLRSRGRGFGPERQKSRPKQQRQYGDILVELRQVDLGDPVVMDGHVLGGARA